MQEHHHTVPQEILKAQDNARKQGQETLDEVFKKDSKLMEFTREGMLKAVAKFIVYDDQAKFNNVWIMSTNLGHRVWQW